MYHNTYVMLTDSNCFIREWDNTKSVVTATPNNRREWGTDQIMSSVTNSEYLLLPESGDWHEITNNQYFLTYHHIIFNTSTY
jgi:hypothetical protein